MYYRIAISSGDFNGIGPEIVLKTLSTASLDNITPVILSTPSVIEYYLAQLPFNISYHAIENVGDIKDGSVNVLSSYGDEEPEINPGAFTEQSGKCAMLAVEKGIELCNNGQAQALVTAPISKEAVNLAGYSIPGHTEFLAEHTDTRDFMMMLVNENLRVGLASVHIPLAAVPDALNRNVILKYVGIMQKSLQHSFKISDPRIAVLGLNPHAGDGGVIGTEEIEFITPAIEEAGKNGNKVDGPYPADAFFGTRKYEEYDGILAMYHDQGLVPFKTLSFGKGVNFTAGLPIIRTSPDHGTAFDIAGQNKADPSSFTQAFLLAVKMAKNRKKERVS